MAKQVSQRREISADIERDDAIGAATRAQIGQEAYELDVQQQCCGGLNFGYFYAGSPIIAYYRAAQPAYTMELFESSSVRGVARRTFGSATAARSTTLSAVDIA